MERMNLTDEESKSNEASSPKATALPEHFTLDIQRQKTGIWEVRSYHFWNEEDPIKDLFIAATSLDTALNQTARAIVMIAASKIEKV